MDPISITAAATSIIFQIVKNGKQMATLYQSYNDAQQSLFMIQTECTVLAAALSQVQAHFSRADATRITKQLPQTVIEALDMSLLGCTMTLTVLTDEISRLVRGVELAQTLRSRDKAKYVWKEDVMAGLLQQLRGQSMALGLLLKAMDTASIDKILAIVESGREWFDTIESDTMTIRETYKDKKFAASISNFSTVETQSVYDLLIEKRPDVPLSRDSEDFKKEQSRKGFSWRDPLRRKPVDANISARVKPQRQSSPARGAQPQIGGPSQIQKASLPVGVDAPLLQNMTLNPQLTPNPDTIVIDSTPWLMKPEALSEGVESIVQSGKAPALGLALVCQRGQHVLVRGIRKHGSPTLVTQNDQFMIGVISSTLTMVVLGRLVDRGLFTWDSTLLDVLPEYQDKIHPGHHNTTISMFGAHLSGITMSLEDAEDGHLWSYINSTSVGGNEARRAALLSFLTKPPQANPGPGSYQWSKVNIMFIAFVIETTTGMSWEAAMKTEVFDPLEMYRSGFGHPDADRNSSSALPTQPWPHTPSSGPSPRPQPYDPAGRRPFNPPGIWPATGIHSSLPDLLNFVRFCIGDEAPRPPLLTPESRSMIFSSFEGTRCTAGSLDLGHRWWEKGDVITVAGNSNGAAVELCIGLGTKKAFITVTNVSFDMGTAVASEAAELCGRF